MRVILSTAANSEEAKKIARHLVHERLAACINIVPKITSIYEWKGEIVEDSEVLLIIKAADFAKVEEAIKQLHSYEVPEIISFEIDEGSREYLEWMRDVLQKQM